MQGTASLGWVSDLSKVQMRYHNRRRRPKKRQPPRLEPQESVKQAIDQLKDSLENVIVADSQGSATEEIRAGMDLLSSQITRRSKDMTDKITVLRMEKERYTRYNLDLHRKQEEKDRRLTSLQEEKNRLLTKLHREQENTSNLRRKMAEEKQKKEKQPLDTSHLADRSDDVATMGENECKICLNNVVRVVTSCGHLLCFQCARNLYSGVDQHKCICPFCKTVVLRLTIIYN